jgi:hypothetical protein
LCSDGSKNTNISTVARLPEQESSGFKKATNTPLSEKLNEMLTLFVHLKMNMC